MDIGCWVLDIGSWDGGDSNPVGHDFITQLPRNRQTPSESNLPPDKC